MRTFVFTDQKSNKFWNIDLQGAGFTVSFGKVGTKGQTQQKDFPDEESARKAHDKLVAEKLRKGYVETTASQKSAEPLRQSLEDALLENPDDLAAHHAYADYLTEQGDPRGEFISVQLGLEDAARPAQERARLQQREAELLQAHAREWLGGLGRFLVGPWSGEDKPIHYRFARGWLDLVRVLPFLEAAIENLARSPEARMLRRLEVVYDIRYHPFEFDTYLKPLARSLRPDEKQFDTWEEATILPPLLESAYLANLRAFKLGFSDYSHPLAHSTMVMPFGDCTVAQVLELLKKCPRLEELYLNTGLENIEQLFASPELGQVRVLQYYFGSDYDNYDPANPSVSYPLTALANNPALTNLTTLRLHPGRDASVELGELLTLLHSPHLAGLTHLQVHMTEFGDEDYRAIADSEIIKQLKVLDLAYGNMTDRGARHLADCPDLKRLEMLDVSRNALTPAGIAALVATGIRVVADNQHGEGDLEYLYEVDME